MNRFTALGTLLSAALLAGCLSSVLPEAKPADIVYRLASSGTAVPASSEAVIMRIDRPIVPVSLAGVQIIVSPDGTKIAAAQQARWGEPVADMIQASFYDYLTTRPAITGILPASGARTTHRAHLTVRDFQAVFDQGKSNAPLATVQYTATVANASSRDLIGTFTVKKTVRASSASVSAIVTAQDKANKEALADIANWMESLSLKS